jgi:hypothetical protein
MTRQVLWLAWPAFLAASLLELLVFAVVDPLELHWSGHALGWSRQAVYTVSFFAFWVVTFGACALATLLRLPSAEVNGPPFDHKHLPGPRPEQGA